MWVAFACVKLATTMLDCCGWLGLAVKYKFKHFNTSSNQIPKILHAHTTPVLQLLYYSPLEMNDFRDSEKAAF